MSDRAVLWCIVSLFMVVETIAQTAIKSLLPLSDTTRTWQRADSISVYSGNSLFGYINGGAELFMENGFNAVGTARYTIDSAEDVQVEVYDMKDSAAAYSTYTSYINPAAIRVAVGADALFMDYYLVFWKAHYVGVLSTISSTDASRERLLRLSTAISERIVAVQSRPPLAQLFLDNLAGSPMLRYCKGRVGLSNFHLFSPGNAFDFKESAAFSIDDCKVLVTLHTGSEEAAAALSRAKARFAQEDTTRTITSVGNAFSFTDSRQVRIDCAGFNQFNIIIITQNASSVEAVKWQVAHIVTKNSRLD
jgi:hypothetical protein